MKRRHFIKTSALFCTALGVLSFPGCTGYRSIPAEFENNKLKIKKAAFLQDNWVVVTSPRINAPVFLSKNENGAYHAVLMLCTHKQCEVKPAGTVLACPCHGAEFAFTGKVLKEPADKDLVVYETSSDENNVYIHLNK